jgi:hypothetical protein
MDLVSDLQGAQAADAVARRQRPETAGSRSWLHPDAVEILAKLDALQIPERQRKHAEMFVRWLRVAMKKERSGARRAQGKRAEQTEGQ